MANTRKRKAATATATATEKKKRKSRSAQIVEDVPVEPQKQEEPVTMIHQDIHVNWVDVLLDRLSNMERTISQLRTETLVSRLERAPCMISGSILGFVSDNLVLDIRSKIPIVNLNDCNLFVMMCMKTPGAIFMPHINYSRASASVTLHVDRRSKKDVMDAEFHEYFKKTCDRTYVEFCNNVSNICRQTARAANHNMVVPSVTDKMRFLRPQSYGFDETAYNCIVEYMFSNFVAEKILERQRMGCVDISNVHQHPKFFIKNAGMTEIVDIVHRLLRFSSRPLDDISKLIVVHVPKDVVPLVELCVSHRSDPVVFKGLKDMKLSAMNAAQAAKTEMAFEAFAKSFPFVVRPEFL